MSAAVVAAMLPATVAQTPAAAAEPECVPPAVPYEIAPNVYGCRVPGGTDPGNPDPGTPGEPTPPPCDLNAADDVSREYAQYNPSAPYCEGEETCILTDHREPWADPPGDKPNDDADMKVQYCVDTNGGVTGIPIWDGEQEPPLIEQAREAVGNIDLGTPQVNASPSGRTVVNLDTWFWASDQAQEVTGSSAFGLVAVGTFRGLRVEHGDGSSQTCPYVATREEAQESCFHEYRRSSIRGSALVGGRPAHTVRMVAVYELEYQVNGSPIEIPGAQLTLESAAGSAALRVDEVQSVVTRVG